MRSRPNFIVFLTDDQGYGDLSCMGCTDFCTPHLDQLAADGARFTDWYSNSAVCSPSRASLMTGRYPGNAGVRSILAGHRHATGLPEKVPTLAEALKPLGYRTGLVGKWHLGSSTTSRPENRGFDYTYGFLSGCVDYYSHIFYWEMNTGDPLMGQVHDLWEDGCEVWQNGQYFTEMVTDKACSFIRDSADSNEPFFLYVAYSAPHYPMHAPQEYIDRFPHLPPDRRIMAAMLSAMDDSVGGIVAELKRNGLYDNTCMVFTSDNGPSRESRNWMDGNEDSYYGGSAGRLKGHKFSLYDGGIRMPAIMTWPGTIAPGTVCTEPVASMDVFPTFLSGAGGDPGAYELDGKDIVPTVANGQPSPHDMIFWELMGQVAVRQGPWKLVLDGVLVEGAAPEDAVHLANLDDDMGERRNLANAHPDITERLTTAARQWNDTIEQRWQHEWLPIAEPNLRH